MKETFQVVWFMFLLYLIEFRDSMYIRTNFITSKSVAYFKAFIKIIKEIKAS